jgi:long-chain acyl-CoA synthetase
VPVTNVVQPAAVIDLPVTGTVADVAHRNAVEVPDLAVYARKVGGRWEDVSASAFWSEVTALAGGVIQAGVGVGDRVGILSRTRYEWTWADFALWAAGAVPVPIYETSSADQLAWILADSGCVALIAETRDHAELAASVAGRTPAMRRVWVIDEGDLGDLARAGRELSGGIVEERRRALTAADLATVIYTSGTTGNPKGCELTHGNLLFELRTIVHEAEPVFAGDGGSTLLFIPLAHVFARIIEIGCAVARLKLAHASAVTDLVSELQEFRPTFVLSVPRVFEKIYNTASQRAHAAGRGERFDRATETAIAYSRAQQDGRVGPALRARHLMYDRLVYARLRQALGGRTRFAVSGGAPLGERLGHFLHGMGLLVLEGYGLTETTGAATLNAPDAFRIGSVGRPLPGTAVAVAPDGEVLVRGPHVMRGYHGNPQATHEVLDADGWLHTGDVGWLDADGYLYVTGRTKELIVTASGKNVAPAPLEDRIRAHPLVSQCLVVGDGQPFVAALITLDAEATLAWASRRGKPHRQVSGLLDDTDLRAEIQTAVDAANATVSRAESVREFRLLDREWTEESGHLTPSLKLRRTAVLRDFAGDVERLYRAAPAAAAGPEQAPGPT